MFTAQETRNISNKAYKEQIDVELASIVPEIEEQCVRVSTVVGFIKLTFHQPQLLT